MVHLVLEGLHEALALDRDLDQRLTLGDRGRDSQLALRQRESPSDAR
jgi:hypothetical protein